MRKLISQWHTASLILVCCILLAGCSPKLDWREVRGTHPPFTVLLPAKPATLTRPVNLDGVTVSMTMTAAEVDGVTYAVGRAQLPEAAKAPAALHAMKTALVRNIGGSIRKEAMVPGAVPMTEIEALGPRADGKTRLLAARFAARGRDIYQVVVLGPQAAVRREAIDTFFLSFKPDQQ